MQDKATAMHSDGSEGQEEKLSYNYIQFLTFWSRDVSSSS